MLCRIDILRREAKSPRVVATRYKTGASFEELQQHADQERRTHQAEGFRLHDLHTGETKEIWDMD